MTQEEIIKALEKQEKEIERKINHPKLYNLGNAFAQVGVELSKVLGKTLPFVFAGALALSHNKTLQTYISTFYSLTGAKEIEPEGEETELTYSTAWSEKDETYYRIERLYNLKEINIDIIKQILEGKLKPTSEKEIMKENLETDDYIFEKPMIILTKIPYKDSELLNKGMMAELLSTSKDALIIIGALQGINVLVFQKRFKDKLEGIKTAHKIIDKDAVEGLEEILELRKRNLELVTEGMKQNESKTR